MEAFSGLHTGKREIDVQFLIGAKPEEPRGYVVRSVPHKLGTSGGAYRENEKMA